MPIHHLFWLYIHQLSTPLSTRAMQLGWALIRFYYKPFKNAPYQRQNSQCQKNNKVVYPGAIIYG
jgi:hypothetical protein